MTDFISCSLCDQGWLADDPDLAARKRRHEEFHANHITNVVSGKVEWYISDDDTGGGIWDNTWRSMPTEYNPDPEGVED